MRLLNATHVKWESVGRPSATESSASGVGSTRARSCSINETDHPLQAARAMCGDEVKVHCRPGSCP